MEILSSNRAFSESLKTTSYSGGTGRRGYNCDGRRRSMKTVRLGGGSPRRSWKMKAVPKLRLKLVLSSPLRLWRKLKNGYLNMMLNLGSGSGSNAFGEKRIPKARQLPPAAYSTTEFDKRLVLEIYKSLVASRELATA